MRTVGKRPSDPSRQSFGKALPAVLALVAFGCDIGKAIPDLVSVDVVVDQGLDPAGASRVNASADPWSHDAPFILADRWEGNRLCIAIHRDVGDDHVERVELWITLEKLPLRAESRAYWYEESDRRSGEIDATAQGLHGTVKLDQASFPMGDRPLLVSYHLEGTREGDAVIFDERVAVHAANLIK